MKKIEFETYSKKVNLNHMKKSKFELYGKNRI